jgi:hypothetical protein
MSLVVAEHVHDEIEGVYRLTIGESVSREQVLTDQDGKVVTDDEGVAQTETVAEIVPTEDIVFAADDDRWKGLEPAEIAAQQRELVTAALNQRKVDAQPAPPSLAAPPVQLPGVGEALG